jgi:hypothetical protein
MNDYKYILICGTQKAGTTSLFQYLADHPDICPSSVKETGFFLEPTYPFYKPRAFQYINGIDQINHYFTSCNHQKIRLEGTPSYLYSLKAPFFIRESLPDVLLLFMLREPVSRLISLYRYLRQIGFIDYKLSFEEFVQAQINVHEWSGFNSLYSGRYSEYLPNYFKIFHSEEIKVYKFTDLINTPREILTTICYLSNTDSSFYENYNFAIHNPSYGVRNHHVHHLYLKIGEQFSRSKYPTMPRLRYFLHAIRIKWDKVYNPLNLKRDSTILITDHTKAFLEDFYGGETKALADILGLKKFSW